MSKKKTNKLPAIQFYPGDFLKDPCVQVLSFESKSVWFFMILLMQESSKRGYLVTANGDQLTNKQLANALQISESRLLAALEEMEAAGTFSRTEESIIYCRRMARKTRLSEVRSAAGAKAKQKQTASKTDAKARASSSSSECTNVHSLSSSSDGIPPNPPLGKGGLPAAPEDITPKPQNGRSVEARCREPGEARYDGEEPHPDYETIGEWKARIAREKTAREKLDCPSRPYSHTAN